MARRSSALDIPFHPDLGLVAQRRRGLLLGHHTRQIRRGAFHSVDDPQNAITRYIHAHNSDCRPFTWTTSAKAIFEKLAPIPVSSV
jgi:hypothetical protein